MRVVLLAVFGLVGAAGCLDRDLDEPRFELTIEVRTDPVLPIALWPAHGSGPVAGLTTIMQYGSASRSPTGAVWTKLSYDPLGNDPVNVYVVPCAASDAELIAERVELEPRELLASGAYGIQTETCTYADGTIVSRPPHSVAFVRGAQGADL